MKKILFAVLACVALAMPNEASAQAYRGTYTQKPAKSGTSNFFEHSDMYYGVRLGAAFSNVSSSSDLIKGGSTIPGLNIGGVVGIALTDEAPLYLESGLSYIQKGGKGRYTLNAQDPADRKTYDAKYTLNYLEIPAVIKYIYSVDDQMSIQPFALAYLDMGVGGKIKMDELREKRPAFSDHNDYDRHFRRFDVGLKFGCGASYDVFYGEIYYDLGLTNTCNDDFGSTHNRTFGVNIGVNF